MDIPLILSRKYPNDLWALSDNDYSGLVWKSSTKKPTKKELEGLWEEVQFEVEYEAVEQTRLAQYAQITDPLFFQYQRGTKTEQDWLDAVQQVKDANPYPVRG